MGYLQFITSLLLMDVTIAQENGVNSNFINYSNTSIQLGENNPQEYEHLYTSAHNSTSCKNYHNNTLYLYKNVLNHAPGLIVPHSHSSQDISHEAVDYSIQDDHDMSNSSDLERQDRFIFTLVRFSNSQCSSSGNTGICYTSTECSNIGGTIIGSCARGFGFCCYKQITCGGSSFSNCTYLVSPNYPGTYNEARTCSMSITRTSDVCQLRLDFEEFESIAPDQFGVCNDDQFTVPGERKFTYLCGRSPQNWHFPCGCGQYYTGNTGTINSFNYGNGFYLAGLDYGICFRKEKNRCTTTLTTLGPSFTACPNDLYRLPVGQSNGNSLLGALNTQNLYCQLNAASNIITQTINSVPQVP
ncbi:hypothetical protein SK128_004536 [Halocaridina rubra]|uniref:CUB domain-containing protein n=1 Tax=Halocaridina rubra TaxID=373956 RepID=A0AAN8XR31_HALRR